MGTKLAAVNCTLFFGSTRLGDAVVKESQQLIIEAIDVEQRHRLLVESELGPREDLDSLLQSTISTCVRTVCMLEPLYVFIYVFMYVCMYKTFCLGLPSTRIASDLPRPAAISTKTYRAGHNFSRWHAAPTYRSAPQNRLGLDPAMEALAIRMLNQERKHYRKRLRTCTDWTASLCQKPDTGWSHWCQAH